MIFSEDRTEHKTMNMSVNPKFRSTLSENEQACMGINDLLVSIVGLLETNRHSLAMKQTRRALELSERLLARFGKEHASKF